jgi:hypothetical protein
MKRTVTLISFLLIWGALFAQNTSLTDEKTALFIRSKTEEDVRKLFNDNGFTVNNFLKGYPECLDGYVFYSDIIRLAGEKEPIVFPSSQKVFSIQKDKIISFEEKWNCEIAFTLTAQDINSNDCIVFIGTNGWAYIFNIYKFGKAVPISLDLGTTLFSGNKLERSFSFVVTGNNENEKNNTYDFTGFANNLNCKMLANRKYDNIYYSADSSGLALVSLNGKWGFIDKSKQEIIPLIYDEPFSFSEELANVNSGGKYRFIDKTGKVVIPSEYNRAGSFSEGMAKVKLYDKWGFVDKTGKEVIPLIYEDADDFSEGLSSVQLNGKYGFIDKTGHEIISLKYDFAYGFSGGLAIVHLNGKRGFIDKTGNEVIPLKYDDVDTFSEGLAEVKLSGKWGYIDKTGQEIIPLTYESADHFSEGLAPVELNDKYGFIDKTGKVVIPFKYDYAGNFSKGFAYVKLEGRNFWIDMNDKEK